MIDKTISRYRIISELDCGGMGDLHEAGDAEPKRAVVLRFLPKELSREREDQGPSWSGAAMARRSSAKRGLHR